MGDSNQLIRVDVAIVGGGVAGSSMATVLQVRGITTAVIERESPFRDRVRGEGLHPWGYREAVACGLEPVLTAAGAQPLPIWQPYVDREPVEPSRWDDDPENSYPEFGISHPRLQEASIAAAEAAGAIVLRPGSARGAAREGGEWRVRVALEEGATRDVAARLLVGADGRHSAVRGWLGIAAVTEPEHHRFGGVLLENLTIDDAKTHAVSFDGGIAYLMPQGSGRARAYAGATRGVIDPIAADHSGEALIELLRERLPEGALNGANAAGPIAFFPNGDVVPDRLTGELAVLIGDAAGVNDPSVGQGLSLVYRDVHLLSDLLAGSNKWQPAIEEYARQRSAYHAIVREHARWITSMNMELGEAAERRRDGVRRAKEVDPTHGGFAFMYTRGPMGLVVDEAARRRFFGEDLGGG